MMKTQAIIFDMDGVIIDSETIWDNVFHKFFAMHNGTFTSEMQRKMMGSSREFWSNAVKQELELGDDWSADRIAEWNLDNVQKQMKENVDFMPGYENLIQDIIDRKIPVGLASGATQDIIEYILDAKGIRDHFQIALSSSGVGNPKPAPDVWLAVAKQMNVDPAFTVGIEDSPNGVVSVLAANMKCIAVPNEFMSEDAAFEQAHVSRESLDSITLEDLTIDVP